MPNIIGTAPNQVPTNGDLGTMAFEDAINYNEKTLPNVIEVNSSNTALRVTQTGTGNALVVEDSANPDSTPFVIDSSGRAIFGATTFSQVNTYSNLEPLSVLTNIGVGIQIGDFASNQFAAGINFAKSRSGTVGTGAIVNNGDALGNVIFNGYDGAAYKQAASIVAAVDGTPGTNDMPGRLVFSTTADGASSPTERMRIDSAGRLGIGGVQTSDGINSTIYNKRIISGGSSAAGYYTNSIIQSDVTANASYFESLAGTSAASFSLTNLRHFNAAQGTFGAGSSVNGQYGYAVGSSLTGATNNYGFYSNIASGTGRYNFYAAGSADNYFAGAVGLGGAATAGSIPVNIGYNLTGATTAISVRNIPTILSDVTSSAYVFQSYPWVAAGSFTLPSLYHLHAVQGSIGAGATVTNQYGVYINSNLTGATNNYGFYSNIAAGTGRYNFYAAGSADNYFAGKVGIGTSSTLSGIVTIEGVNTVTDSWGQLAIRTSDVAAIDKGALIALGGKNGVSTNSSNFGTIAGRKENATDGNSAGYLAFGTTTSGNTNVERMRIDSSGNLISTAPTTAPTLSTNGTMVFNLTSNTNLRVSVRGSDGVTRTANITLA